MSAVIQIESSVYSRYDGEACNSGGAIFEETLQRWRAVDGTVSDLTDPRIEPQTSRSIAMSQQLN